MPQPKTNAQSDPIQKLPFLPHKPSDKFRFFSFLDKLSSSAKVLALARSVARCTLRGRANKYSRLCTLNGTYMDGSHPRRHIINSDRFLHGYYKLGQVLLLDIIDLDRFLHGWWIHIQEELTSRHGAHSLLCLTLTLIPTGGFGPSDCNRLQP